MPPVFEIVRIRPAELAAIEFAADEGAAAGVVEWVRFVVDPAAIVQVALGRICTSPQQGYQGHKQNERDLQQVHGGHNIGIGGERRRGGAHFS